MLEGQRRTQTKDRIRNTPKVWAIGTGPRAKGDGDRIGVRPIKEQEGQRAVRCGVWQGGKFTVSQWVVLRPKDRALPARE